MSLFWSIFVPGRKLLVRCSKQRYRWFWFLQWMEGFLLFAFHIFLVADCHQLRWLLVVYCFKLRIYPMQFVIRLDAISWWTELKVQTKNNYWREPLRFTSNLSSCQELIGWCTACCKACSVELPYFLWLVRLGTGTQQLLVKLIQLYLAGYYHRLALTRSPKVAFGRWNGL